MEHQQGWDGLDTGAEDEQEGSQLSCGPTNDSPIMQVCSGKLPELHSSFFPESRKGSQVISAPAVRVSHLRLNSDEDKSRNQRFAQ